MANPNAKAKLWSADFCKILLFAVLCQFTMSVSNTVLPLYVVNYLGLTATQSGLLGTIFTIASCLCRFVTGGICDRIGWKRTMILGGLLVGIVLILMGFTPAFYLILVLKALQGIGHSINSTASNTAVAQVLPSERFGEGIGYYGLHSTFTNALGPTISLALMATAAVGQNYSLPLFLAGIGGMIAVMLAASTHQAPPKQPPQRAARTVSIRDFIEPHAFKPALLQCVQSISVGASIYMILFANYKGFASVSYYYILTAVTALAVRFLVGKRMDTIKPAYLSSVPIIVLASSFLYLACTMSETAFILSAVASGLFNALLTPTYNSLALKLSPKHRSGAASATYWLGFDLGMAIGQIVFGMIIDTNGGNNYSLSFLVAGVYLFIFCLASFGVLRKLAPLSQIEQPDD